MPSLADLDAITFDANGTLVQLVDPVPELDRLLRARGLERPVEAIRRAFEAEATVYASRSLRAHEPSAFAALQTECTAVFLGELGANGLAADEFAPSYVSAMRFEVLPGVHDSLTRLRACGLDLAIVANFDLTLAERLDELELRRHFSTVVTPAEAGVTKPDRRIFGVALERLDVQPDRALHIGDGRVDEEGARAAGMHFGWAPVPDALEAWR